VKITVAARVNNRCLNPACRAPTSGRQVDPAKALNVGVAAHITAASPDGPRYNSGLTSDERKHANNAIWLCHNCGKLIDNDQARFTTEEIRNWKISAEAEALERIGKAVRPRSLDELLQVYRVRLKDRVNRGGHNAVETLVEALNDEERAVRWRAAYELAQFVVQSHSSFAPSRSLLWRIQVDQTKTKIEL
jgi:hypothetical protein